MSIKINKSAIVNISGNSKVEANFEYEPLPLTLELYSIGGPFPATISDPYNLSQWNNFFDLPNYGTPFNKVIINGNNVNLYGGRNIQLKSALFSGDNTVYRLYDYAQSITSLTDSVFNSSAFNIISLLGVTDFIGSGGANFYFCISLTEVYLPKLTTLLPYGDFGFNFSMYKLDISSCTNLGGSSSDDNVFSSALFTSTFTLIANDFLRTNLGYYVGSTNWPEADGDIQFLDYSYTLNVTWV